MILFVKRQRYISTSYVKTSSGQIVGAMHALSFIKFSFHILISMFTNSKLSPTNKIPESTKRYLQLTYKAASDFGRE